MAIARHRKTSDAMKIFKLLIILSIITVVSFFIFRTLLPFI